MNPVAEWSSFYAVLGTAAGSLIGLQFIMMALMANLPPRPGDEDAGNAFASPTVVHFSAVLFVTAVAVMPWHRLGPAAWLWGASGAAGLVYTLLVARRMRTQSAYAPVLEDWLFHALFPCVAYTLLALAAAMLLPAHTRAALFTIAFAALLLLFVGVHNAWDSAAYIVFTRHRSRPS